MLGVLRFFSEFNCESGDDQKNASTMVNSGLVLVRIEARRVTDPYGFTTGRVPDT